LSETGTWWVRNLSTERGPFRFFYRARYKAGKDGFWHLVSFEANGHEVIKNFPSRDKMELIKKFGKQAYRAMAEEAEKKMKLPSNEARP